MTWYVISRASDRSISSWNYIFFAYQLFLLLQANSAADRGDFEAADKYAKSAKMLIIIITSILGLVAAAAIVTVITMYRIGIIS